MYFIYRFLLQVESQSHPIFPKYDCFFEIHCEYHLALKYQFHFGTKGIRPALLH